MEKHVQKTLVELAIQLVELKLENNQLKARLEALTTNGGEATHVED